MGAGGAGRQSSGRRLSHHLYQRARQPFTVNRLVQHSHCNPFKFGEALGSSVAGHDDNRQAGVACAQPRDDLQTRLIAQPEIGHQHVCNKSIGEHLLVSVETPDGEEAQERMAVTMTPVGLRMRLRERR